MNKVAEAGVRSGQLVIDAHSVSKVYNDGVSRISIFEGLDFRLAAGESVGVVGSSGAGKTSLLNILAGLDTPTSGNIQLCGLDFSKASNKEVTRLRNRYMGFVYQFHHLLAEFSAIENVAMPLTIAGLKRKDAEARAMAILSRVGLADRASHKPSALSGGERQRVAIARALVNDPSCVLMDEPTGNLDEQTAQSIQEIMLELQQDLNTSFVIVTHDIPLANRMDRTLLLEAGELKDISV
jgi:lipoprotein-releasing system ATP-binding protein